MRIISRNILIAFWSKHQDAEEPLKAWFDEAKKAKWKSPNELKKHYKNASIISDKRVVFNIKGNHYRLVADIEYYIGIVFIIWIGTHKDYNKLNIKDLQYAKTYKNKK
ncbi:MAG: type II toxin-antitoxin system HigB family toxin [Ignavibacteriales bacterium]|nr:type II toxin-antitoxin system HigB family toxin [Ignavibacteriales bacterium]